MAYTLQLRDVLAARRQFTLAIDGDVERYRVDWGDGTVTNTRPDPAGELDAIATHAYAADGSYRIAITGRGSSEPASTASALVYVGDTSGRALRGGAGIDYVLAGAGDDRVRGEAGDDYLDGGAGNDRMDGGDGADLMFGGQGNDVLSGGGIGFVEFLDGGDGNDALAATGGFAFLLGGAGDDTIDASGGLVRAEGGDGNDVLTLHAISGELVGGAGDDRLYAGEGFADQREGARLVGGAGADQLYGGLGTDLFVFEAATRRGTIVRDAARDTVFGFEQEVDQLDTTAWGLDGDDFVAAARFSGEAPELRAYVRHGMTIIEGDFDGDGRGDFSIALEGAYALVPQDFVTVPDPSLSV